MEPEPILPTAGLLEETQLSCEMLISKWCFEVLVLIRQESRLHISDPSHPS